VGEICFALKNHITLQVSMQDEVSGVVDITHHLIPGMAYDLTFTPSVACLPLLKSYQRMKCLINTKVIGYGTIIIEHATYVVRVLM
jgi:hypothetical protein